MVSALEASRCGSDTETQWGLEDAELLLFGVRVGHRMLGRVVSWRAWWCMVVEYEWLGRRERADGKERQ